METNKSSQNSIEKLMAILSVHLEPEVLGIEIKDTIAKIPFNKARLKIYLDTVRDIRYAWKKVGRYQIYFKDFYPKSEGITEIEALTHHVHAYLEDLNTFENKLIVLLGILKNDANEHVINSKEFKQSMSELTDKIRQGFKKLDDQRGQHRHKGMRYVHNDLLKAENAYMMIEQLNIPPFCDFYSSEIKEKLKEKLSRDRILSFEKAKNDWIELARINQEHLDENTDKLFEGLATSIYQILCIDSTAKFLQELSDREHQNNQLTKSVPVTFGI